MEAAGYLFCLEVAPTDHQCVIQLRVDNENLIVTVTGGVDWADEYDSPADLSMPGAWQHSRDRVAALDGTASVQYDQLGMRVCAVIPVDPPETPSGQNISRS